MQATTNNEQITRKLKESKEGFVGGPREKKRKREMMSLHNVKT